MFHHGLRFALFAALAGSLLHDSAHAQDRTEALILRPPTPAVGPRYGHVVGIDGQDAVILGRETGALNGVVGYSVNAYSGQRFATLRASDQGQGDQLGFVGSSSKSIGIDNGVAVIDGLFRPAPFVKVEAVYALDLHTGSQLQRFVPQDGVVLDRFGSGLSIDGTQVLVGAPWHASNGVGSGAVYLFDLNSGNQLQKFVANDSGTAKLFGSRVAVEGTLALITSPGDDAVGQSSGSAYVFDLTSGQQVLKLLPTGAPGEQRFGASCAVDGSIAVIGAPGDSTQAHFSGVAYVFDLTTGQLLHKLSPSSPVETGFFGQEVSIAGRYVAVGAPGERVTGIKSGAAYVFDLGTGAQVARVAPSFPKDGAHFGQVAINSRGLLLVGSPEEFQGGDGVVHAFDTQVSANAGHAYCFGDGTGPDCPCGVNGAPGEGCPNASGTGALLQAAGKASLSSGNFSLKVTGVPSNTLGVLFRSSNAYGYPLGGASAHGVICVLGNNRSQIQSATAGVMDFTHFNGSSFATGRIPGDSDRFQLWYRDSQPSCAGPSSNFSNGWWMTWKP